MKILLIYPSRPGKAVGNVDRDDLNEHVSKLATTLSQQGHDVRVQELHQDPVQHMDTALRKLEDLCSEDPPDLVHAHLWPTGLAALATLRRSRIAAHVPIILTFHTVETAQTGTAAQAQKWQRLEAAVARSVDHLTASSSSETTDLISLGARRDAISMIPHAVDTDVFTPGGSQPSTTEWRRLVAVGPMAPETGFDIAINALSRLPDAELVIAAGAPAGEDSEWPLAADREAERLVALAEHLGLTGRVTLITSPTRSHIPPLLRSAEIVLCTPWRNSPGTAAIEAMASGKPVIATAVGELLDVVIEGTTGVLVPPRDPRALANALRDLLNDPVRLEGFGLAAVDRAHIWHSWDRVGQAIAETYDRVLTR